MSALIDAQTVYRIGRKRAQHAWRVHVVGDDAIGYRVQVRTRCGIAIEDHADASLIEGFVTCGDCEDGAA